MKRPAFRAGFFMAARTPGRLVAKTAKKEQQANAAMRGRRLSGRKRLSVAL